MGECTPPTFDELIIPGGRRLLQPTLDYVKSQGYTHLAPVQAAVLPIFLGNNDVAVEAVTGSGKTLAFLIPIFERLVLEEHDITTHHGVLVKALILAPTQVLVEQLASIAQKMSQFYNQRIAVLELRGGRPINIDRRLMNAAIKEGCDQFIVVATPGRICGHQRDTTDQGFKLNKDWTFRNCSVLVMDEADKLLAQTATRENTMEVLSLLPKQRRTGLFSATLTAEIVQIAKAAGLRNPVFLKLSLRPSDSFKAYTTNSGGESETVAGSSSDPDDDDRAQVESNEGESNPESADGESNDEESNDEESVDGEAKDGDGGELESAKTEGSRSTVATNHNVHSHPLGLSNFYVLLEATQKLGLLLRLLNDSKYLRIVVFTATCSGVDYLYTVLTEIINPPKNGPGFLRKDRQFEFIKFHGQLSTKKAKTAALSKFSAPLSKSRTSNPKVSVLLASDAASRGVDFPDVNLVVQMEPPKLDEDVFHRAGRTARAGKSGDCLMIVSPRELQYIDYLRVRGLQITEFDQTLTPLKVSKKVDSYKYPIPGTVTISSFSVQHPTLVQEQTSENGRLLHDATFLDECRIILMYVKACQHRDRRILELAKLAWVKAVQAAKSYNARYLLSFHKVDLGILANAFGLTRLPQIKEIRGRVIGSFQQDKDVDPSKVEFRDAKLGEKFEKHRAHLKQRRETAEAERKLKRKPEKLTRAGKAKKRRQVEMDSWEEIQREERLAKKLARGKITQEEFDAATEA